MGHRKWVFHPSKKSRRAVLRGRGDVQLCPPPAEREAPEKPGNLHRRKHRHRRNLGSNHARVIKMRKSCTFGTIYLAMRLLDWLYTFLCGVGFHLSDEDSVLCSEKISKSFDISAESIIQKPPSLQQAGSALGSCFQYLHDGSRSAQPFSPSSRLSHLQLLLGAFVPLLHAVPLLLPEGPHRQLGVSLMHLINWCVK